MRAISWLAEIRSDSQEGLCSMELSRCWVWVREGGKKQWPVHQDVYFWWLGSNDIKFTTAPRPFIIPCCLLLLLLLLLLYLNVNLGSRDSSDGIATRCRLDDAGMESRWGRDFPHLFTGLGPTQPLIQGIPALFPWGESDRGVALHTLLLLALRLKRE